MRRYEYPWRVFPAHICLHLSIFIGTILWALDAHTGQMHGMNDYVYSVWVVFGFASSPLMLLSYHVIFLGGGHAKYLAFWIHFVSNICGLYVLAAYVLSNYAELWIDMHHQAWFAYVVTWGGTLFALILVINDLRSIHGLEKMASSLQIGEGRESELSK